MEDGFFIKYTIIALGMIGLGIGIKKYLKKSGIADSRRILGLGVFWLKFSGNALLIIGTFCLLTVGVTFYYFLKSEGII
jgi:hypothetical protein